MHPLPCGGLQGREARGSCTQGPLALGWHWVLPLCVSLATQRCFCPLPPRPVYAHGHTQMPTCAQTHDPPPPHHHPSHTHIAQTHSLTPTCHHQIPQEKRSHPGWAGLGRSAFLTYLFFPPLEHCSGSPTT